MNSNSISLTNTPYVWPEGHARYTLLPRTTCLIPPMRTIHRYFVRTCENAATHTVAPLRIVCTVRSPSFPLRCGPLCRICGDECKLQGPSVAEKVGGQSSAPNARDTTVTESSKPAGDAGETGVPACGRTSADGFRPFWYCNNNHSFWFACYNDMECVLPENPRCYCLFTTRLVQDGERFYYRCASAGCGYIVDYPVDIWPPPSVTLEEGKEMLQLLADDGGDDYFEDIFGPVSCVEENADRIFQQTHTGARLRAYSFAG
ncbi:hypothetical protein BROUX41_002361 [Berkeleyomyces rouxiae]|uniref:uncharacterized protein n=1 Tax=Berkeleyomyces rouxiae TaxID=2035830 RepID=UPI003B7E2075